MKLDRFKGNHYQQFQPEQQLNISTTNPINIYGDGGGVQTPEPDLHSKNPNESVRQARMNVTDTINKNTCAENNRPLYVYVKLPSGV